MLQVGAAPPGRAPGHPHPLQTEAPLLLQRLRQASSLTSVLPWRLDFAGAQLWPQEGTRGAPKDPLSLL